MDQQSKEQLNIREMTKEDVPQVFDLERRSFNDSSWTIDAFYHEIEQNNFAKYFVLEFEQQIIGYLGLWIVIDQAHTCDVMSLEVRVNNKVAQHVYENLGFQYGGKRKNYYGEGEDAMVMWVNLND